jgi:hypothetical protein
MAAKIVNNGLQRIGVQASQATSGAGPTYNASRHIQTMCVDDNSNAFAATDADLDRAGSLTITNHHDVTIATPTRSGQVISHVGTFASGVANFTIRRISLHDNAIGSVDASSDTLVAGIDGQTFAKTSDFSLVFTLTITYSDAS